MFIASILSLIVYSMYFMCSVVFFISYKQEGICTNNQVGKLFKTPYPAKDLMPIGLCMPYLLCGSKCGAQWNKELWCNNTHIIKHRAMKQLSLFCIHPWWPYVTYCHPDTAAPHLALCNSQHGTCIFSYKLRHCCHAVY